MKKINISNDDLISIAEFREFLFEPIVPVESICDLRNQPIINSLAYWRRHNLLPFLPKNVKFEISFAQCIWLRILDHLRELGYSVNDTRKVCDYFFKDAYDHDLPKLNLEHTKKVIEDKIKLGTSSDMEEAALNDINIALKDDNLLYAYKFFINYLTNLIIRSLEFGKKAGIYIFRDGQVMEHIEGDDPFNHNGQVINLEEPHIYISITHFLTEFIKSDELSSLIMPTLLNEDEKLILREIRRKNVKELYIKINDKKIIRIDSKTEMVLNDEKMKEIKTFFGIGNYEEVSLITRDEKTMIFTNTKKKRLR
jgi:hypothetical protein